MLITKTVKIKWCSKTKKHYETKGYIYTKIGNEFEVNVEDLTIGNHTYIECLCDYCLEKGIRTIVKEEYREYIKSKIIIDKDSCEKCKDIKTKESNIKVYGVDSIAKLNEVKEKKKKYLFR